MTPPSIGRVVYYRPSALELASQNLTQLSTVDPFRADVAFVNLDGSVNLTVCDHAGQSFQRTLVPFFDDQQDGQSAHAHWMPYQRAQAAAVAAPAPAVAEPLPVIDPPPAA